MRRCAKLLVGSCLLAGSVWADSPSSTAPSTAPTPAATPSSEYCAVVSSAVDTYVSSNFWGDPTLYTVYVSRTWTTLRQEAPTPTSYPWTFIDSFFSSATDLNDQTFSDGHSTTFLYTMFPVEFPLTRVETAAPTATPACAYRVTSL